MRGLRPDEARENRVRALFRFIVEYKNGNASLAEVYQFAFRSWGYRLRKATIDDYVRVLLYSGDFKINNDHIIYKKEKRKEEEGEEKDESANLRH
jgi:hypothetical protein